MEEFSGDYVKLYTSYFSHIAPIVNRDEYYHDEALTSFKTSYFKIAYFTDRFQNIFSQILLWLCYVINTFISKCCEREIKCNENTNNTNIGIEQQHHSAQLNGMNDLFMLKHSDIEPNSVYYLDTSKLDSESEDALFKLGIPMCTTS